MQSGSMWGQSLDFSSAENLQDGGSASMHEAWLSGGAFPPEPSLLRIRLQKASPRGIMCL